MADTKSPLPPLSFRSEDEKSLDVVTAVGLYNNEPSTERKEEKAFDSVNLKDTNSENIEDTLVSETTENLRESGDDKEIMSNASNEQTDNNDVAEATLSLSEPADQKQTLPPSSGDSINKSDQAPYFGSSVSNTETDLDHKRQRSPEQRRLETPSSEHAKTGNTGHETNRSQSTKKESKIGTQKTPQSKSNVKSNSDVTDSDRYTDSNTTGGRSSIGHTPRSFQERTRVKGKSKSRSKSPKLKKGKSILRSESPKPLSFMSTMLNNGSIYRHPTRGSSDCSTVTLPVLNSTSSINKVYVDDTEKILNRYPKRDKDFKLEFVYDIRPKYPSHYVPEKKMSRREAKVFSNISGIYADYKSQDDRTAKSMKKREERMKKIEQLKHSEEKDKRREKIERALEQYEQLKDVREKFEILCWYRNHTQYITPRVLEHEKLSRHMYGLPESLEEQEKLIKNLRRKSKKRNSRVKSH